MRNATICAVSTPYGISGIGIVRLSGPRTLSLLSAIFTPRKQFDIFTWPTHTVRYGHIHDRTRVVDEVLVTFMKAPATYTREDMAEIGCHGGIAALKTVLTLCVRRGARLAEPGEFTKRAFLNGRIDLAQAESVLTIIASRTEEALALSLRNLDGGLTRRITGLRARLLDLLAVVEASLDFPEEEGTGASAAARAKSLKKLLDEVEKILAQGRAGRIAVEGVNAAIVGRPNVGKSSLLNTLLGEERAIVTEIPGTTRDALCETISIKGIPVRIIDTAGIRKSRGTIEKMGVRKAKEWMEKAELNMLVLDASKPLAADERILIREARKKPCIIVLNKTDLPKRIRTADLKKDIPSGLLVAVSATEGTGIETLRKCIYNLIIGGAGETTGSRFSLNLRQEGLVEEVRIILERARKTSRNDATVELLAEDLREAIGRMDTLTGKEAGKDVLEKIFGQFCIGK